MQTPDGHITIGSLIKIAQADGWNAAPWISGAVPQSVSTNPKAVPYNLAQFEISNVWQNIPHREWLLPPLLVAKHYSMLVATGASGKSAVAITMALALLTGRKDLLGLNVVRQCKVLLINGEDGQEELVRRVRAACLQFGINRSDVEGRLHLIGARQVSDLTFNRLQPGGAVADQAGLDMLQQLVQETGADAVIIDPLGSFLPGGTNDGASASAVAGRLTEICVSANCAMLLVHHTSKAAQREGDNDPTAALGSAMWTNHARSVINLRRLTVAEAQAIGKPPSAIKDLLVLLHSKANLSKSEDPLYIELVSVDLPNAKPPLYPRGDSVGVAVRIQPGTASSLFTPAIERAVIAQIATGTNARLPYKASGRRGEQDYRPDIAKILAPHFSEDNQAGLEQLAKDLVEGLIKNGRLTIAHESLPRFGGGKGGGKTAAVLRVPHAAQILGTGAPQGTFTVSISQTEPVHGQSVPTQGGTELPLGGMGESGAPKTYHQRSEA